jgi:hypothetical protein
MQPITWSNNNIRYKTPKKSRPQFSTQNLPQTISKNRPHNGLIQPGGAGDSIPLHNLKTKKKKIVATIATPMETTIKMPLVNLHHNRV